MTLTLKGFSDFCDDHNIPSALARAVVRQHGTWVDFKEDALYFAQNGIDGNCGGFICYVDARGFTKRHRKLIAELVESKAESIGVGVIEMVQGFRGLPEKPSKSAAAKCLYGGGDDQEVMNILAWFAAEEVLAMYQNFVDDNSL
jgi:hypothetical protein